ncbi:MAG TPA: OmpA family protein [Segetibacter sp.]|jgi:outer membrane protein OmpA-like peptidoglycan-associated protein
MMFKFSLLVALCSLWFGSSGQNLVANGSFEDRNICTEYHALCAPEAWFFIPESFKAAPKVNSSKAEVLISGKGNIASNYIYTKLLCRLAKGEKYDFSVWITTEPNFEPLDVWMGEFEPEGDMKAIMLGEPNFKLTDQNVDSTRDKWKRYSYRFTATGDERFLMIGNLVKYEPPRKSNARSKEKNSFVLYFIDDIALHNADMPERTCPEYNAVLDQVYRQDLRHPARLIEDVAMNNSLLYPPKKEITWLIVDTPPSMKQPVVDTLIIPDILFTSNSSEINKKFSKRLDSLLNKMTNKSYKEIEVVGHTDNEGTDEYNQQLSVNRATAIKQYILTKKLSILQDIHTRGAGEYQPRASNKTPVGRQQNRRVEIILKQ